MERIAVFCGSVGFAVVIGFDVHLVLSRSILGHITRGLSRFRYELVVRLFSSRIACAEHCYRTHVFPRGILNCESSSTLRSGRNVDLSDAPPIIFAALHP